MMIKRRIAKLEIASKRQHREYVVYVRNGETEEQALARFFEPYAGETWPVFVSPEPCATIEEWLDRYAPENIENRRAECPG